MLSEMFRRNYRALSSDFAGSEGGGFDLRFSFSRSAKCALRLGDGPRTFGFSCDLVRLADRSSHCPMQGMVAQLRAVDFIG